jgi:mannosyltransferase OCH1-like enzyme
LDDWYKKHWLSLEERSPGWRVCFIDDNMMCDMIASECRPREVQAFKALNPKYGPARADFLRYHLMRSRGGMWLDGKSGFTGVLEENLAKWLPLPPLVFGHWGWPNQHDHIPEDVHKKGEIQQWFLISAPQHPVWDEVLYDVVENIENYDEKVDGVGKFAVLKITGPIAMSRTLYPLLSQHPHLHVKDKELGMLYDCLGGHEKKQTMMGSGTHYSKLNEPIVLYKIRPDPPPPPPALAAGAAPVPGLIIREAGNVTYIPPGEL